MFSLIKHYVFKAITIFVLCNFFTAAVKIQAAAAAISEKGIETRQFEQIFNDFAVPLTTGRITEAKFFGSKQIVINIQDMHRDSEVQRNISKILAICDEKYKINNVYIEGAMGNVCTKWLTTNQDEKYRLAEKLLDKGELTGVEHYSILSNKSDLIIGIDDEQLYKINFLRYNKIIEHGKDIENQINDIKDKITVVKKIYYNSKQMRLEKICKKYKDGEISANIYFSLLKKYVNEQNINLKKYKNMADFMEMNELGKKLNHKKILHQLNAYVDILKEKLPQNTYDYLNKQTNNFTQIDKLYIYLIKIAKEYRLSGTYCFISKNYPELNNFFKYVDLSQQINTIDLIQEEKKILKEIQLNFVKNDIDKEIIFLTDFINYVEDYLNNKISAADYEYFNKNLEKFKILWQKYIDKSNLSGIELYFTLFNEYYSANIERNKYFLKNAVGDIINTEAVQPSPYKNENIDKVVELLNKNYQQSWVMSQAPKDNRVNRQDEVTDIDLSRSISDKQNSCDIVIIVTGGFHSDGLSKLLAERKISYLVITPNITNNSNYYDIVYDQLAKQQSRIITQTFAPILLSCQSSDVKLKIIKKFNNFSNSSNK